MPYVYVDYSFPSLFTYTITLNPMGDLVNSHRDKFVKSYCHIFTISNFHFLRIHQFYVVIPLLFLHRFNLVSGLPKQIYHSGFTRQMTCTDHKESALFRK